MDEERKKMMTKQEKILERLEDQKFIDSLGLNYKTFEFLLIRYGDPKPYARPRKGRGGFYNPLSKMMNDDRDMLKGQLDLNLKQELEELITSGKEYYVEVGLDFYIKTQTTSSIKDSVMKELKMIRPNKRPDLDNYDKYILDVLHEIAYDDDKNVISLKSEKYYSLQPRTEINIKITIIED